MSAKKFSLLARYEKRSTILNRRSFSFSKEVEEHMIYDDAIIRDFLAKSDVPHWHRGISQFQTDASERLLNALRDDAEQRTSHRVRACMLHMGLDPMISAKQTKFLMRLSRNNDLAFLWFLMELHYKTNGPNYSLNEQTIMSIIANLDMITTIRELDRILPPGHDPIKVIEARKLLKLQKQQQTELTKKRFMKPKHKLPYFDNLERPQHYGKALFVREPDFQVNLGQYEKYKNPLFVVQNEFNRWYIDYDLSPSKRIVNRIINDELANIFEDFDKATLKGRVQTFCEHHKVIHELEVSFKQKLKVIAREQCMRMLDANRNTKEANRKRMMHQLEQDIGAYVCKFHKIAEEAKRQCTIQIRPNECTGYDILFVEDTNKEAQDDDERCEPPTPPELAEQRDSIAVDRDFRRESGGNIFMLSERNKPKCPAQKSASCDARLGYKGDEDDDDIGKDISSSSSDSRSSAPARLLNKERKSISILQDVPSSTADNACPFKSRLKHHYDSEQSASSTSELFFEAPTANKPYQFDYPKIYRFKDKAEQVNIRKAIVEAIDSDPELPHIHLNTKPNLDAAVQKCVAKIWREQVALKNIELEAEAERKRLMAEDPKKNPLKYETKIYDPDDKTLMLQMLKNALKYMSKNPKFVLASMPDSYKMPVLLEWIRKRYGKRYTSDERLKSFRLSLKIFRTLEEIQMGSPNPKSSDLGKNLFVDYSCHDYLLKKGEYIKKKYYKRLNDTTMDQARIFWYAMKPYLCSGGPPRGTYYAYMPAGINDIKRFRIWRPDEYINAKVAWEKKKINNRNN